MVRGDSSRKNLALIFTGHEFADGADFITRTLLREQVQASFFFTGDFYRNKNFGVAIKNLLRNNHYLGAHSDRHLLYCDWNIRDSLLVSRQQFRKDIEANYAAMKNFDGNFKTKKYFLPPYEWYNDSISVWTSELGLQLVNYTPGTRSHADYTVPGEKNYRSSEEIYKSIIQYDQTKPSGLNGFLLLLHIGTDPKRTDKFYHKLPQLIRYLKMKGYQFQRVDELLRND